MRLSIACCGFAAILLPVSAVQAKPPQAETPAEAIVSKLQTGSQAPGAQFAAAVGGRIVESKGFGYADVSTKEPVRDDSLFMLASGSKPFTAIAIFTLIDDGKLSLDTKAFPYLGLHAADGRFAQITIAQLLNHSSGLNDNIRIVGKDPLDIAKAATDTTLLFKPGKKQSYSNTGFNVLGAVIEKAGGQDYRAYVQAKVFAPAGVTAAALDLATPIPGQVKQYDKSSQPAVNTIPLSGTPAGGWVMSATDIVKVLVALDADKLISAKSREAMFGPLPEPLKPRSNGAYYGGGWDVVWHDPSGRLVYGKNGGTTGAYSWMEHDADGAVFALLYNGGSNAQDAQWASAKPIEKALAKPQH